MMSASERIWSLGGLLAASEVVAEGFSGGRRLTAEERTELALALQSAIDRARKKEIRPSGELEHERHAYRTSFYNLVQSAIDVAVCEMRAEPLPAVRQALEKLAGWAEGATWWVARLPSGESQTVLAHSRRTALRRGTELLYGQYPERTGDRVSVEPWEDSTAEVLGDC